MSYPYLSDLVRAITGYSLPIPIPMFGLCVALAMIISAKVLMQELDRRYALQKIGPAQVRSKTGDRVEVLEVSPATIVSDLAALVMVAGIVGARLFHILEHTDEFLRDPSAMIFTRSGLSIFGGLIMGVLAGAIYVNRCKIQIRPMLDAVAPVMMLGYAIGRIGCQISGDGDWGIVANMTMKPDWLPTWCWAQTYIGNIVGEVIPAPGVYPTPMYETVISLACFAVLWVLRRHIYPAGWLFSLYLLFAGIERLAIEQIRINPVFNLGFVHATQAEIIASILIILGVTGVAILSRRTNNALANQTGSAGT